MPQLQTYSFLDTQATLSGPGGSAIPLGAGAAVAEEGITIESDEDKDSMQKGADGSVAHSLHAIKTGRAIVRLLKTSPTNQQLSELYNFQTVSSLFHGQNVLTLNNVASGDSYTCQGVAFAKFPANTYAKDSTLLEWTFNVSQIDVLLGSNGISAALGLNALTA